MLESIQLQLDSLKKYHIELIGTKEAELTSQNLNLSFLEGKINMMNLKLFEKEKRIAELNLLIEGVRGEIRITEIRSNMSYEDLVDYIYVTYFRKLESLW